MKNKELKILLSAPRGFCAGVERAIEIVEKSIQKYGAPVYVRHEIVHNKFVVDDLKSKGAIFVEELEEIKGESETIAGLILEIKGGFPKKGEVIKLNNYEFTIDHVDRRRIHRIKLEVK